jgi:hypothetical protein
MGKFYKGYSRGLSQGMDRAFKQRLDPFYGGHGSRRNGSFADNLTQSIWNDSVAPGNNRPGREFLRRGRNTDMAGRYSQEIANGIIRGSRPGGKKRGG